MAKKKQATALSTAAIAALRNADYSGNTFRLRDDNLPCYAEIKSLMSALGGKWVSRTKTHDFPAGLDARSLVLACCDRGEIPASNPLDYFPTPPDAVEAMTEDDDFCSRWNARITCAELAGRPVRYLEPNGGSGALVRAMAKRLRPCDELVIVELNPALAALLRKEFPQATVIEADFLSWDSETPFDVVLMNPPFDGKEYAKHVKHAYSMLCSRGILAAIVPSGFRTMHPEFRDWAAVEGDCADLGSGRFEGTAIGTSILWLSNDPDNHWRDKPYDDFSSWHAWHASVSISTDGDILDKIANTESFQVRLQVMQGWAENQRKELCPQRMDETIAREVLASLSDYLPAGEVPVEAEPEEVAPVPVDYAAVEKSFGEAEQLLFQIGESLEKLTAR